MNRLFALALMLTACGAPAVVATPEHEAHAPTPQPPPSAAESATQHNKDQREFLQAEALRLAPQLAKVAEWEAAGDKPVALVPEIAAFAARLPTFTTLLAGCHEAPAELLDVYDENSLARPCALARRAHDVVEEQYLLAAKRAVRFPENLRDAARRYERQGRVAWQTLRIFQRLESDMAERTAWLQPYARQLGLPILGELFHEGFAARRDLRRAIRQGRNAWALPGDVTDTAFVKEMTPIVAATADEGPMPGQRGELLQVRVIDAKWAVRVQDGHAVRRERRLAALWKPKKGACLITWLQAKQAAQGGGWQKPSVWLEDDLRLIRCPR